MQHHSEPRWQTGQGFPWMVVKVKGQAFSLRIPEVATASDLVAYYSGIVTYSQNAAAMAKAAAESVSDADSLAKAEAAKEAVIASQAELYGALGFVLLTCWRDPFFELEARTAYLESYPIRKAISAGAPLEAFDQKSVDLVLEARRLISVHKTDLKSAFGLVAWDELCEAGLSHEAISEIAKACASKVFESIKSKEGSGVEIIADF